jgi:hypothetical protein
MANVYVEARPKGRPEGSRIDDYVVEDHADHVLATFRTQREAIDWARSQGHAPLIARVRNVNDKKKPDHWRSARVDLPHFLTSPSSKTRETGHGRVPPRSGRESCNSYKQGLTDRLL